MVEYVGRFRVERLLGTGAFATVWLALDERLNDWIALKVLAENWSHDDEVRRRFLDEAKILRRVESSNIVPIHDVDELDDGRPYMVMAFADRGTLDTRLAAWATQGHTMPVDLAVDWSLQIATALEDAHHVGVANRDLKPANVMFRSLGRTDQQGRDERLWVGDFGIAKDLARGRGTTLAAGTPHYMAPEQLDGRADERSDIYAAGVVLYQMLAGVVPYPQDSLPELIRALADESAPPLESLRADVPPHLVYAVRSALSIDPAGRPQTADAWRSLLALDRTSETGGGPTGGDETSVVPPPGTTELELQAAGNVPPEGPPRDGNPDATGGGGRPVWLAVALVALVGLIAATVGVLATRGNDTTELVLEPVSSVGNDPFTQPVVTGADGQQPTSAVNQDAVLVGEVLDRINTPVGATPDVDFSGVDLPPAMEGEVISVSGSAPGLYGGTTVIDVCNKDQLTAFLLDDEDKGRAWAGVQGIEFDEIGAFIDGLTDVILQVDTRVTNHGFADGEAQAIDSVLQAGTAVLVDEFGVPRVRCYCGNPLDTARVLSSAEPEIVGESWPDFDLAETVIIAPEGAPVEQLVLDDLSSDNFVVRPAGQSIDSATLVDASGQPLGNDTDIASPEPTTVPEPTTPPPEPTPIPEPTATPLPAPTPRPASVDITSSGSVSASSVFNGSFAASLAVDGSRSSSWFSAGGGSATFNWSAGRHFVETIEIQSNSSHSNVEFRTGFGFGSVTVRVLDAGAEVFSQSFDLGGTPDPDVLVPVGVNGDTIVLAFTGGEDPSCGGFGELIVRGVPA